jgi:hypothetical protein
MRQLTQNPSRHRNNIRQVLAPCIFAITALGAAACGSDNPINPPIGQLRVANAITDSNPIDATVVNIPSGIDNIAFGTGSGLKDIPDGSYRVQLTTTTNAGQSSFAADPTHIDKNHITTIYAVGRLAQGTQAAFVVEAPRTDVPGDKSELQFVNAASQQTGPLDIYLTAPGASLVGVLPTTNLAFPASNSPALVTPGKYEIRVTPQGNPLTVLFDSGPLGVQLPASTSQQFSLLDSASATAPPPMFLLVLTGGGGNFKILNGSS